MYYFIINPTSSSGKCLKAWEKVKAYLEENKIEYRHHILTGPGNAAEIAARLSSSAEPSHLVILGGDGTLSEVLSGIVDFKLLTLSILRAGSGNDFARNMKIEKDVIKALKHIISSPEEFSLDYGIVEWQTQSETVAGSANTGSTDAGSTDAGSTDAGSTDAASSDARVCSRRFAISCGVGYDADICQEVSVSRLKVVLNRIGLGKLVYLVIGLKQIFFRQFNRAVLTIDSCDDKCSDDRCSDDRCSDDKKSGTRRIEMDKFFLATSMIHEMEGGGVPFCPGADPTDGMLNGCFIGHLSKLQLLPAVMLVYLRRHTAFKGITLHKYNDLTISLDAPEYIHADGDVICKSDNAKISVKNGLRFVR